MRGSKYTRAVLLPVVQASTSLTEVIRTLGLRPVAGNDRYIAARIRAVEVDTSHFTTHFKEYGALARRCRALTLEELAPLVADARSLAEILRKLELPTGGGTQRSLLRRIRELALEMPHYRGEGWSRGETRASHPSVDRTARSVTVPDERIFIANSEYLNSSGIIRRLLARGRTYICAVCEIETWRGQPLRLQLDHINGISNDHRIENLRFLCDLCRARHNGHYAAYVIMPRRHSGPDEDRVLYAA